MKKYEFTIKIEGLQTQGLASVGHDGALDAENMENAAKEVVELAKKINGEFTKCTVTLEEKS